jgi:YVTN family beta-propeller protein
VVKKIILSWFVCLWSATAFAAHYKVLQKVTIGGEGGWDYLTADAENRRLYVTHGGRVQVFDLDSLKSVGSISGTPNVHHVAVAPALGKGFVTNGKIDSIFIFDLKNFKKTGEAPTGMSPDALVFDPASSRVFVFNAKSNDATVIDGKTGEVAATVPLGGKPEFGVADGAGHVYVDVQDKNSVAEIDTRQMKVTHTIRVGGCEDPSTLAMDPARHRLFVGCRNQVMAVVDSENYKTLAKLPIGPRVDSTVFDPDSKLVFNSTVDGNVTVIDANDDPNYQVKETVPTQIGARTMALDSKTHKLFLITAEFGPQPPATADNPHPRTPIVPGTFTLLVVGK